MAYPEKCNLSSLARSLSAVSGAPCAKMSGKDAVYGRFRYSDLKEAAFGRCRLWGLKGPDGGASIGKATIWGYAGQLGGRIPHKRVVLGFSELSREGFGQSVGAK